MLDVQVLDALALLLDYPGEGHGLRVREAAAALEARAPDLAAALAPFCTRLAADDPSEAQELYTRTFDWSPERALELGWHLFGEQYERGAFLVRMRALLRAHGVEEGSELPDRLGSVLRLLGRMPPREAEALAAGPVQAALARIRAGFADEPAHPYLGVLAAVERALPPAAPPAAALPTASLPTAARPTAPAGPGGPA